MSIESKLSGHWTDEELVRSLYGVGPENDHLDSCAECGERIAAMRAQRSQLESVPTEEAGLDFLAAQRRAIYNRLEQPVRWWSAPYWRRFVAGTAAALSITASVYVYQENRSVELARERVSDAQLLQEVTAMASMDSGSQSAGPLQELFE